MTNDQLRQNGASNGQVMTSSRAMGSVQELTETESHTGSSRPSSWQASAAPVSLCSGTKQAAGHHNKYQRELANSTRIAPASIGHKTQGQEVIMDDRE